jgi:hypothetical protein
VIAVDEAEWLGCTEPKKMLAFLGERASARKFRLFAVACCRRVWRLLVDQRSREAVEVAEHFADGAATDQELAAAKGNAWEFSNHTVHSDERFFDLDQNTLDAADVPAWAAGWSVGSDSEDGGFPLRVVVAAQRALGTAESNVQADLVRCIFGNPFRPVKLDASWVTPTVNSLAAAAYQERSLPAGALHKDRLAVLADALLDAGCTDEAILDHLRRQEPHVRGCFLLDALCGKE